MDRLWRPLCHKGPDITAHAPGLADTPCLPPTFGRSVVEVWFRVDDPLVQQQGVDLVIYEAAIGNSQSIDGTRTKLIERRRIKTKLRCHTGQIARAVQFCNDFTRDKVLAAVGPNPLHPTRGQKSQQ